MKNVKQEILIWFQLVAFVAIWVAILFVTGTGLVINWEALKKLPDVVTVYVLLSFAFTRWLWRWSIFRNWLVPFPDLQGTWEGTIQSTWKNPATDKGVQPINAILVVRQTFSSISCVLFTSESDSYSSTAQIVRDDDGGIIRLSYNYTNRPRATVRDRSTMHDGAALLRIVSSPKKKLEGEYWTSRCTTGDISLTFRSRQLLDVIPKSTSRK
jgi:hypothetical protein